jgi:histidine ammonia-lyase
MGNAAGLKCLQVLANAEAALAIELLARAQGIDFLAPLEPGAGVRAAHDFVRTLSPTVLEDRPLSSDIEALAGAIGSGELVAAVEQEVGALR